MSQSTIAHIDPTTNDDSRAGSRLSRRTAIRRVGGGLTAAVALTSIPRIADAGPEHTQVNLTGSDVPNAVLGAWDLTYRRLDAAEEGEPERALITFAPDGGFQAAAAPISVTPDGRVHFNSGGLGGWSTSDVTSVVARYTVLSYDDTGAYAGMRTVSVTVQPDQEFGTLTGAYVSERYDLEGSLAEFDTGSIVAVPARARGILRSPALSPETGPVPVAVGWDNLPPQPGLRGEPY